MAQFPTSIISYPTNPVGTDATSATLSGGFTHSGFHGSNNDELEAIQTKLGIDDSTDKTSVDWLLPVDSFFRNALINSNMEIDQVADGRGETSYTAATFLPNNDDNVLLDGWRLLSDGNDAVDVSRDATNFPDGSRYSMKSLVATANKKWGFLQILESSDSVKFRNEAVSLSFQAKTTSGQIENLRAAVLSWDSTADSPTTDVVSAWAVEGTNPTFATNWTAENTASNLVLTDSFQTFSIENISVDTSGMNNLAVFIWVDDTDAAVNDELYITQIQLNAGAKALRYIPRSYSTELTECQYWRAVNTSDTRMISTFQYWLDTNTYDAIIWLPVRMRAAPTITLPTGEADDTHLAADSSTPSTTSYTDNSTMAVGVTGPYTYNFQADTLDASFASNTIGRLDIMKPEGLILADCNF